MNPHPDTLRVLDPEALSQTRALEEPGQTSLLAELVDAFRDSSHSDLTRLKRALVVGDHETVLNAAHRLRGAAAALGADRVRSIAQTLELCGREHSLVGAEAHLIALESAREQVLLALSHEVGS
jgi:HPt (histidine-containing phosphotransfer) domain-containing protein